MAFTLFVAAAGGAGQLLFGPSFQVSSSTARTLLFLFFIVTVAVMLMPAVPLPVGAAGVLSLWALFRWGTLEACTTRSYWGVSFVAVVAAVYLGTVLKPWTPLGDRSFCLVLASIAASSSCCDRKPAPRRTPPGSRSSGRRWHHLGSLF